MGVKEASGGEKEREDEGECRGSRSDEPSSVSNEVPSPSTTHIPLRRTDTFYLPTQLVCVKFQRTSRSDLSFRL